MVQELWRILEKIKVVDMPVEVQHQGRMIKKVTPGAPRFGVVDKVVESHCLQ